MHALLNSANLYCNSVCSSATIVLLRGCSIADLTMINSTSELAALIKASKVNLILETKKKLKLDINHALTSLFLLLPILIIITGTPKVQRQERPITENEVILLEFFLAIYTYVFR